MTEQRLMVVGSGWQVFREYALAAMSRQASLVLVSNEEPTWQLAHVAEHCTIAAYDSATLLDVVRELKPDGIVTYDETLVEVVAGVADAGGIARTAADAVRTCKDKNALRDRLGEAWVSPVGHALTHDAAEAAAAAAAIGYPVVLKPRALQASIGVVRVDNERELLAAYPGVTRAEWGGITTAHPGVLVEQYLEGPEYSVDCVTWRGELVPLVLAAKSIGFRPYFEEVGHVVPGADQGAVAEAIAMLADAHRAIGLDALVTHNEFRLTPRGPRIIEINPRLGGDLIPYLGLLATGIDVAGAAAAVALGREPDVSTTHSKTAMVSMVYPPHDLRVRSVGLRGDHASYPGLDRFATIASPGEEIRLPPRGYVSRLAMAVVVGSDRAECERRWSVIEADLVIDGDRLNGR